MFCTASPIMNSAKALAAWGCGEPLMIVVGAGINGLGIARDAGANEINADRMWHYVEGISNWDPIWPMHAI